MNRTSVVRNIPKVEVHEVRKRLLGGTLRGRGPRLHNGRRYYLYLPIAFAERFTLYPDFKWDRQYFDYVGTDNSGKIHLRFNQAEVRR